MNAAKSCCNSFPGTVGWFYIVLFETRPAFMKPTAGYTQLGIDGIGLLGAQPLQLLGQIARCSVTLVQGNQRGDGGPEEHQKERQKLRQLMGK